MRCLIFILLISQLSFSQSTVDIFPQLSVNNSFDPNRYFHTELFRITPKTSVTYTKFEETIFPDIRHAETLVLFKTQLSKNTSFLFGNKTDFFGTKNGFILSKTRISASTGIQFDTKRAGSIQGLFNYQLNNPNNILSNISRSSFNLRTQF